MAIFYNPLANIRIYGTALVHDCAPVAPSQIPGRFGALPAEVPTGVTKTTLSRAVSTVSWSGQAEGELLAGTSAVILRHSFTRSRSSGVCGS